MDKPEPGGEVVVVGPIQGGGGDLIPQAHAHEPVVLEEPQPAR